MNMLIYRFLPYSHKTEGYRRKWRTILKGEVAA